MERYEAELRKLEDRMCLDDSFGQRLPHERVAYFRQQPLAATCLNDDFGLHEQEAGFGQTTTAGMCQAAYFGHQPTASAAAFATGATGRFRATTDGSYGPGRRLWVAAAAERSGLKGEARDEEARGRSRTSCGSSASR